MATEVESVQLEMVTLKGYSVAFRALGHVGRALGYLDSPVYTGWIGMTAETTEGGLSDQQKFSDPLKAFAWLVK